MPSVSLPTIAAVSGLAGAGVSAVGAYGSAQAQSANAAYQAQVATNNAAIARRNAVIDIQAGETAATNAGLKARALVGQEKAAQGASGVEVSTGTAPEVRTGTERLGLLNAMTIRSNAAKEAYGQEVAATSQTAQSQLYGAESKQFAEAAPIGAAGTLLSQASTVGGAYARSLNVNPTGTGGMPLSLNPADYTG